MSQFYGSPKPTSFLKSDNTFLYWFFKFFDTWLSLSHWSQNRPTLNTQKSKQKSITYWAFVIVFWHKLKDSLNTGIELWLIHHEWITNFYDDFIHSTKWTSLTTCACFFCYFSFGLVLLCRSEVLQGLRLSPRKGEKKGEKVEHSLSTERDKTAKSDPDKRERCTNQRARFHLTAL